MKINSDRLLENLRALRRFTDTPGEGVTRFSYGEQDKKAREYISERAKAAGCSVRVDDVGNIRIGLPGNVPGRQSVLCGSHIDTVRNGGWLDGAYGVCGALEVLECLAEGVKTGADQPLNYEMVIFAEEEGTNFGSTMTGGKFLTGKYGDADLDKLTDDQGRTLREVLAEHKPPEAAGKPVLTVPWDLSSIAAMLELHIEQGPMLERAGRSIGIVDAVFGMRVIEVMLTGAGNHAGTTPMKERKDALCAAAECILAAEEIVSADPEERTVVTVGKIEVQPNCSNVIPEAVRFSLEVRDSDADEINGNMERIIHAIRQISMDRGVYCQIREVSQSDPMRLDEEIIRQIHMAAEEAGIPYLLMDSGAVHDACMIAETGIPTGMIFVPSIDGRSHVPEEDTKAADLIAGAQLLLDVVEKLRGNKGE